MVGIGKMGYVKANHNERRQPHTAIRFLRDQRLAPGPGRRIGGFFDISKAEILGQPAVARSNIVSRESLCHGPPVADPVIDGRRYVGTKTLFSQFERP